VQWTGAKAKPIEIMRTYELLEEALLRLFLVRQRLDVELKETAEQRAHQQL